MNYRNYRSLSIPDQMAQDAERAWGPWGNHPHDPRPLRPADYELPPWERDMIEVGFIHGTLAREESDPPQGKYVEGLEKKRRLRGRDWARDRIKNETREIIMKERRPKGSLASLRELFFPTPPIRVEIRWEESNAVQTQSRESPARKEAEKRRRKS